MPPGDVEVWLDGLRRRGLRVTSPRRAVAEALLEAGSHVTVADLVERIRVDHPGFYPSTVYRAIEAFVSVGLVDHVHLGHGRAELHLAEELHRHLVCDGCQTVVEAPDELFETLAEILDDRLQFRLSARHFSLGGSCRRCRDAADPPDAERGAPSHDEYAGRRTGESSGPG